MQSLAWDSQPLPAYQYFENVRNFINAAGELKLPAFEASDLEKVCQLYVPQAMFSYMCVQTVQLNKSSAC